jgi:hypothetical protein
MNQLPQQYQAQFWQEVISAVVALAIIAMIVSDAIKAIKEAVKK